MKHNFENTPRQLIAIARAMMGADPAHGWPHIVRVHKLSRKIAEGLDEPVNWRILEAAILLHDIGRSIEGVEHHAVKSARFAGEILPGLGYGVDEVESIVHAIRSHSFSLGEAATTLEAKILSDADKLDALGAVGIARVIHTGCRINRSFEDSLRHFHEKILGLPEHMYLEPSRRMAYRRLEIVRRFVSQLEEEL
ncbi:MAG: HD domain-containing protein [Desulfurococcales archaeon]|nr:HD domain-containing protein [Desulfurococcales archaeon]